MVKSLDPDVVIAQSEKVDLPSDEFNNTSIYVHMPTHKRFIKWCREKGLKSCSVLMYLEDVIMQSGKIVQPNGIPNMTVNLTVNRKMTRRSLPKDGYDDPYGNKSRMVRKDGSWFYL